MLNRMNSLQKLCLISITEEFERFYSIFKTSNDDNIKRDFEFLQRYYSFDLAKKLAKKKDLDDSYLEFIINKHLKKFISLWFKNASYLHLNKRIFYRLSNLTRIYFPIHCNDKTLKIIVRFCPKLVEINVTYSNVTNKGVKYLCKDENGKVPCPELKRIYIKDSEVTDRGVRNLIRNLPSLQMIDSPRVPKILYSMHKKDLPDLKNTRMYNFLALALFFDDFCTPDYSDLLKVCLTLCPRLNAVSCFITSDKQLNFFTNNNLRKLKLFFRKKAKKMDINNFIKNNRCNLTNLELLDCTVSITNLIISLPNLKELLLYDVTFQDTCIVKQAKSPYLSRCVFGRNKNDNILTAKVIDFLLSSSPKLKIIEFEYFFFSSYMKVHILKCCKTHLVEMIILKDFRIEANFVLDILLKCPSLKSMKLYCTTFSSQETSELMKTAEMLPNKPRVDIDENFDHGFEEEDAIEENSESEDE